VVGKLRTHEDKNVADLAKETVRKWKNDVAGHKKPDTSSSTSTATTTNTSTIPSAGKATSPVLPTKVSTENVAPVTNGSGNIKTEGGPAKDTTTVKKTRDANTDGIKNPTGEKVRDSSIMLLYNAIVLDSEECPSPALRPPRPTLT
jgi:transcription elongation factor S-II